MVFAILSAACATADRAGQSSATAAQFPLNAVEACVPAARIAELERELEGLKAENTMLIGRILGIDGAGAGKNNRLSTGQGGPHVLREESDTLTQPPPSARAGAASDIAERSALYGAHLASYRELSSAQAGWRKLKTEYPEELAGLEARVKKITLPQKGEFLRLIGGPFASKGQAAQLCSRLETRNLSCRVIGFDGVPIITGGAKDFESGVTQ